MDSTINFNPAYGDISFSNTEDLDIIRDRATTDTQAIINLFKSSFNDYKLTPEFGMDLDRFIGTPIDEKLALDIKAQILRSIKSYDLIANTTDLTVMHIIKNNTIHFRLVFSNKSSMNFIFLKEEGFNLEND